MYRVLCMVMINVNMVCLSRGDLRQKLSACHVVLCVCFQRLNPLPHHRKQFPNMSYLAPSPTAAASPDLTHMVHDVMQSRAAQHSSPPASYRAVHDIDGMTSSPRAAHAVTTPRDVHERTSAELSIAVPVQSARAKSSPSRGHESGRDYIHKQVRKAGPRRLHVDLKGMKGTVV